MSLKPSQVFIPTIKILFLLSLLALSSLLARMTVFVEFSLVLSPLQTRTGFPLDQDCLLIFLANVGVIMLGMVMAYFFKWSRGVTARLRTAGLPDGPPMQVLIELMTYWQRAERPTDDAMFPSRLTLCTLTGYSERTVQRAFRSIERSKLLTSIGGGTGRQPLLWQVSPELRAIIEAK